MAQIFCFGASLTYGYYDSKGGWVVRLRKYLDGKDLDGYNVYGLGIPIDETSVEVVNRLENELEVRQGPSKENVILINIGVNDSQFLNNENRHKIPPEVYRENLRECVKISKRFAKKILFLDLLPCDEVKVNPIPWKPNRSYKEEYIKKYQKILRDVCAEEQVHFIEMYEELIKQDYVSRLRDGIHPDDKGHEMIFKLVKNFLIKNKIINSV